MNFRTDKEVSEELSRLRALETKLPIMVRIGPSTSISTRAVVGVQVKVLEQKMGVDAVYANWQEPTLAFALGACEWRLGGSKRPSDFWRKSKR